MNKNQKIKEKIVNLLLVHSGSMEAFTEMKGYLDQLEAQLLKAEDCISDIIAGSDESEMYDLASNYLESIKAVRN